MPRFLDLADLGGRMVATIANATKFGAQMISRELKHQWEPQSERSKEKSVGSPNTTMT
jgi:hypothetical protein